MRTLYWKLAVLLTVAFAAVLGGLLLATRMTFDRERLIELAAWAMVGGAAFALLAALSVFQLFTRRLRRLTDAVEAISQAGFAAPARLPGASADGDEIDQLAMHIERMAERISWQLAELDRTVGRRSALLANVSHDLRTPLASMQGYLELLLLRHGSLDAAEERNYLETAVRHCERLGRLVGDLFELTRLEADEAHPQLEDFSIAELMQDVVQKFALDASRREVHLQATCDAATPQVHADIGMVERVLVNLLDNALRHTPPGGDVTLELNDMPERARLSVRDNGSGIAPHELATVFSRYDRVDRSAPASHGGLGLAIAQRIVRLHGSEISVDSTPGRGSCFAFELPHAVLPRGRMPHDNTAAPQRDVPERIAQ